jgi:ribosomal protein S1
VRHFEAPPREGQRFDFTLGGQEDGLWALSRVEELPLFSWDQMEVGALVQARVTGHNHGGLELKVGDLHAFMPRSQTGLARGADLRGLLGKRLPCQVTEVDRGRQRVTVSRKLLLERERRGEHHRAIHGLRPGQVVRGQVTRIEDYGAFVGFGRGATAMEGLIHVSNLSLDPVAHPSEVVKKGEWVEARVLSIRREGKRIALGLKQMQESPWKLLEKSRYEGQLVEGTVTRAAEFGVFVRVERGVEGLLPNAEAGLGPDRPARDAYRPGQPVTVRIVSFDAERERMTLSRLHPSGAVVRPEEAAGIEALRAREAAREAPAQDGGGPFTRASGTNLGRLLERALVERRDRA